jgi:hypothetical protein
VGGRFQSIAMLSHGSHSLSLAETGPPGCKPGSHLSYGPIYGRPNTLVKDCTSVFKNRIDTSIGSVDLSSSH